MLLSQRIRLRLVEEADLPLLVQWRNEPYIWSCFFNKVPLSMSGQKNWYRGLLDDRQRLLFIIEDRASREALGTIGLDRIDHINQTAEYGNILLAGENSRGKGMAREATELLVSYAFGRLNINRVYLNVLANNARALQLYKSFGFQQEGLLKEAFFDGGSFRDIVVMALLRSQFRPSTLTTA